MIALIRARAEHFRWLLADDGAAGPGGLTRAAGGVAPRFVLEILAATGAALDEAGVEGQFLIVENGSVEGLCGLKAPPRDGVGEIGYGVAESRQGRGVATEATRLLVERLAGDGLAVATAETVPSNVASIRVLEANGFSRVGERIDPEDGPVLLWRRALIER